MSLPLIVRPEAEQDIADGKYWYDSRQPGLGDRFVESVEQALHRIEQMPLAAAEVFRGARLVLVHRFPDVVIDRLGTDHIAVIAVYHTSRNPRGWQGRT